MNPSRVPPLLHSNFQRLLDEESKLLSCSDTVESALATYLGLCNFAIADQLFLESHDLCIDPRP
jgi:hypothetical protein